MGGLSLHPSGAYLQAIGRPGAETAPAARRFRLPPHPRTAAPPAAVRGRRSPPGVPQLPAPPRRSDPRRAAARPARARGEQWTGRGGAGWGRAGGWERSAGDQERRRAGGTVCERRPAPALRLDSSTEPESCERGRRGRGRPGHEDPGAPPMRQASPTQGPSAISTLSGLGKKMKRTETAHSSMALGRGQPALWTAH